jgi:hypothetical protein
LSYEAIKLNFQVLYRSIFDLVRDFLKDEAFNQQDRVLRGYREPICAGLAGRYALRPARANNGATSVPGVRNPKVPEPNRIRDMNCSPQSG